MSQIKSDKWDIKEVFKQWYCIPDYQRFYVWEEDQIIDSPDDIHTTYEKDKESDHFLGSLVLGEAKNKDYIEYDISDGRQRLTTLLLLTVVTRDLTDNEQRQSTCHESIFQKGNPDDNIPERLHLILEIRHDVKEFIDEYTK